MSLGRIIAALALWVMALVPMWMGGALVYFVIWPAYLAGTSRTSTSVSFPSVGFLPGFSLTDGEIVLFAFGCLVVAAGFIVAGYVAAFRRSCGDKASGD